MTPTWVQLAYLACAVCFILALKGLSGPKTARYGNLVGAAAAVVAVTIPFFYLDLDHVALILVATLVGTVGGVVGARKVQMTQMPQMVALFNGVGGGAAALVACWSWPRSSGSARTSAGSCCWRPRSPSRWASVSFAGSIVTFAKLQDLMTSAPGGLPGTAGHLRGRPARHDRPLGRHRRRPGPVGRRRPGAGRACRRGPAGAAGRWRRRTDRDLAAQRLHRPDGGGERLRAREHPPAGGRHARRGQRYLPDPADGQCHGPLGHQHPLRRPQGRVHARRRRGLRPSGEVGRSRTTSRSCWGTPTG